MTDAIFRNERVRLRSDVVHGVTVDGQLQSYGLPAGVEGTVERRCTHPIWGRCCVVRCRIDGRQLFCYVPVELVESAEASS